MRFIEIGGSLKNISETSFRRKIFIKTEDLNKQVNSIFNNTDVFRTIYEYEGELNVESQESSKLYGPFVLDFDTELKNNFDLDRLRKDIKLVTAHINTFFHIPNKYIKLCFSGNKGFHLIINEKIFGLEHGHEQLNEIYKYIASELKSITLFKTIDLKIYDKKRLLRVQNSINSSTGKYKVPISFEQLDTFTYDDLMEYSSSKKVIFKPLPPFIQKAKDAINTYIDAYFNSLTKNEKEFKGERKMKVMPICMTSLLEEGAKQGCRNNSTVILASCLFQLEKTREDVLNIILDWNNDKNSPPISEAEVRTTVNSAYREYSNGKIFGCSSVKNADLCQTINCKRYMNQNQRRIY